MILISACLCGVNCKYNHENNSHPFFIELIKTGQAIPICPEQLGGLPTPRPACEILNGTGREVLEGTADVVGKDGQVLTAQFIRGAQETLKVAHLVHATTAILKGRSPSCGVNIIYDGTFTSRIIPGDGVTAAFLRESGVQVLSDEQFLILKGEVIA